MIVALFSAAVDKVKKLLGGQWCFYVLGRD